MGVAHEIGTRIRRNHLHGLGQIMHGLKDLLNLGLGGVICPPSQTSELKKRSTLEALF